MLIKSKNYMHSKIVLEILIISNLSYNLLINYYLFGNRGISVYIKTVPDSK
jgi:hypothetical protein